MELSEVANHLTSDNCFLFQQVECEYKRFGCAVVLPRKDVAEHLKTSVQAHLQMTKRRVEEQEVRHQEQKVRLKEQEVRLQEQEGHLHEEKAERQVIKKRIEELNKAFAHMVAKVKQLERNQKRQT